MLSATDIAGMRSTVADSLPDTAAIGRYTATSDGAGGVSVTYPVAAADAAVPCRIDPVSTTLRMTELIVAEREVSESNWIVTFAAGVTLTEKDRITIGGFTYEAAAVFSQSSWAIDVRVLCRLVQ
jgi:hypothetical protein